MKLVRPALLLVLLIVVLDLLTGVGGLIGPPLHFAFGWIFSIMRLAQRFQFSWAMVWWVAGFVAFVLFVARFCARFGTFRPPLRMISAFTGIGFCSILAGMALAGSVHQLAWLAASKEPWFGRGLGRRSIFLSQAASAAGQLMDSASPREEWEKAWRGWSPDGPSDPYGADFHSRFATHLRSKHNGEIEEIVVWPRNGDDFRDFGGIIVRGRHARESVSRAELLILLGTLKERDER